MQGIVLYHITTSLPIIIIKKTAKLRNTESRNNTLRFSESQAHIPTESILYLSLK